MKRQNSFVPVIIAGTLGVLMLAGAGGGALYYRHLKEIRWQQDQIAEIIGAENDVKRWVEEMSQALEKKSLTEEEKEVLKDCIRKARRLEEKDYAAQLTLAGEVKSLQNSVNTRLEKEAQALLEKLQQMDSGYATMEQRETLKQYSEQMQGMIQSGDFDSAEMLAEEWEDFAQTAAKKKSGYNVRIMQHDFSEYPRVRLYIEVRDSSSGESVQELSPNMFIISERDAATGDFLNRTVQKAVRMNENERLNIDLLADTSGSMAGSNLAAAKNIIWNFLDTLQFAAGDQIKLTQFNSIIDKSGFFTNDLNSLRNTVGNYVAGGGTKLYDSIIYGVQDIAGQEGARCVIAFTDGCDVGSYNTADQVVEAVSRYRIPVYIVRVGDGSSDASSDGELRRIADMSGGSFKNMAQFSSGMNDFYNEIYRNMKEYYVVEYESDNIRELTADKEIAVYIQNGEKGGEASETANPGEELFDSLLGNYLRSYIHDMNQHSYDQLSQYVDSTVATEDTNSIQWQMKKQVTNGFNNVYAETLMDYQVISVDLLNDDTILMKAVENYEVIYEEIYGELKVSEKKIAKDQLAFLQSRIGMPTVDDGTRIRFWGRVRQQPEYLIKRGADGKWRFSQYAGEPGMKAERKLYDVEIQ